MNNQEKAQMYDDLVRDGDNIHRKISKLKAENAGMNLPDKTLKEINQLENQLLILENKLNNLMSNN